MAYWAHRKLNEHLVNAATLLIGLVFFQDCAVRTFELNVHVLFVSAVVGISKPVACALLCLLTLAQAAAVATLLIWQIYVKVGVVRASALLASTQAFEVLLYGAAGDALQMSKLSACSLSLLLVALIRHEAGVRGTALGVPIGGNIVTLQSLVRSVASRCKLLWVGSHMFVLCAVCAVRCAPRFAKRRDEELNRAWWAVTIATGASSLLLASQDNRSRRPSSVFWNALRHSKHV